MILTGSDERYLTQWQTQLTHPVKLRFGRNQRPETAALAAFIEDWRRLVPGSLILSEDIPEKELPGLLLDDRWRFCAVPTGIKLELLGEILLTLDGRAAVLPPAFQEKWQQLPLAPELTIFVAPQCPFCPQMVRQLMPLTVATPAATVTLIDVSLFIEEARQQEIKAVPTVIVNGVYRLTGAFQLGELLDLTAKTDPALLPTAVLERMMQEGQAGVVGDLMVTQEAIFPNFLPLLWHPEINIRLGAMVALETVGTERPELVAAILPRLWQEMPSSATAVQGDLIYLIGVWGDAAWLQKLEEMQRLVTDADVAEAVAEAVTTIRERALEEADSR